jgi:hypothetical protein
MSKSVAKKKTQRKTKAATPAETDGPVDVKELRRKLVQLIAGRYDEMTNAMIDEAAKGYLAQYKFLLEVIGLYPPIASEKEEAEDSEDLAQLLLKNFVFPKRLPEQEGAEPAVAAVVAGDSVE